MRTTAFLLPCLLHACAETPTPLDDAGPAAGDAGPDAAAPLDPGAAGPWEVGVVTVELEDPSRERLLPVEVWYPVDEGSAGGEPNVYDLGSVGEIRTSAVRGAPAAAGGPWPLVIFSHGFGGIRYQSYFLTEHLASHGIVVAAPDHPGNTIADFAQLGDDEATARSAIDRPADVLFVLDQALWGDLALPAAVDAERVGVTGHSFGGWTALEVARRDARFAMAFPMAPGFREGATPELTAEIGRPLCLFGGSADETTPFETDQRPAFEAADPPKLLVEILGAGHLDFSNLCDVPELAAVVDDGCDPSRIEPGDVQDRVRAIAMAFVGRYLLGDVSYDSVLEPSWIKDLGKLECWSELNP